MIRASGSDLFQETVPIRFLTLSITPAVAGRSVGRPRLRRSSGSGGVEFTAPQCDEKVALQNDARSLAG
jgi:hypothetical protein